MSKHIKAQSKQRLPSTAYNANYDRVFGKVVLKTSCAETEGSKCADVDKNMTSVPGDD